MGLEANIPRLEAQQIIRELTYRPDVRLTSDQVYDLWLTATQDPEEAEKAWKAHRHAELRAGITPR